MIIYIYIHIFVYIYIEREIFSIYIENMEIYENIEKTYWNVCQHGAINESYYMKAIYIYIYIYIYI